MNTSFLALSLITFAVPFAAFADDELKMPDFTKGGSIPAKAKHDWNLGATGLRGWIFCDKMVTSNARQIAITKVEKGSPADGVFRVKDVILGVGGMPFSYDPHTEFGMLAKLIERLVRRVELRQATPRSAPCVAHPRPHGVRVVCNKSFFTRV